MTSVSQVGNHAKTNAILLSIHISFKVENDNAVLKWELRIPQAWKYDSTSELFPGVYNCAVQATEIYEQQAQKQFLSHHL